MTDTQSRASHTPTPWRWGAGWNGNTGVGDDMHGPKYADLRLYGADGNEIIPLRIDHHQPEWDCDEECGQPSAADRAYIVRACNSHDLLLAACQAALRDPWEPDKWRQQLTAAIAAATGE